MHISQENTCAGVSFYKSCKPFTKKRHQHKCFPVKFAKCLRTAFPQMATSVRWCNLWLDIEKLEKKTSFIGKFNLLQIQCLIPTTKNILYTNKKIAMHNKNFYNKFIIAFSKTTLLINRSITLDIFLDKSVLKICSKFTGEHPCRSVISIKLQSNCKFAAYF